MAGITSTKKIKGQPHLLAYITPSEAKTLENLGGQKTMTPEGIPAYPPGMGDPNYGGSSKGNYSGSGGNQNTARENYISNYVSQGKVKGGGGKKPGTSGKDPNDYYDAGLTQTQINNAKKFKEEQQKKSDDYNKAKEIYNYQPNKALNFIPFIGSARNIFGTPFTKAGKTRMAKRRMEYINSLPPQQRRAMIERLGYAEDEDYDELDEFALNQAGIGPFNQEDVDPNFGRFDKVGTDYNLTGNPLSYVGENPIYGMNAYDIINYDGEYLKKYGQDLTNTGGGGGGEAYLPYVPPLEEEDVEDEKTFDYRFGTGQKVGADVTRGSYIFNQGGRVPAAGGGIMNVVPRQGYFLGKIVKGVGKAIGSVADAAGKVLKSDLGKAAMLYAGGVYLGGGNIFSASAYNPANFLGKKGYLANIAGKALLKDPTKGFGLKNNLSLGKMLGLSALLPFIPGINKAPPNEDIGMTARGGRLIDPLTGEEATPAEMRANIENAKIEAGGDPVKLAALNAKYNNMLFSNLPYENYGTYAQGGRIGFAGGGGKTQLELPFGEPDYYIGQGKNRVGIYIQPDGKRYAVPVGLDGLPSYAQGGRVPAQEGGLMDLGGMEKDYRNEGGFVPIGREEKADDVPARLSVNEFVFTADAVRNAGGGDIDKGAEVMENMMKNLENGGRVSEESQGKGNTGAQEMFSVSERIGEVI